MLGCYCDPAVCRRLYYQSFYPFIPAFLHRARINILTVKRWVSGLGFPCCDVCLSLDHDVVVSQVLLIGLMDWLIDSDRVGILGWGVRRAAQRHRRKKHIIGLTRRPGACVLLFSKSGVNDYGYINHKRHFGVIWRKKNVLSVQSVYPVQSMADMEFVKNFTHPDFQAKNFTPQKCDIFLANQQHKCIKYQ